MSAGATTPARSIPSESLAETCRERDVWLHVDAAYGGFAASSTAGASS